jgi:hypothetical protein
MRCPIYGLTDLQAYLYPWRTCGSHSGPSRRVPWFQRRTPLSSAYRLQELTDAMRCHAGYRGLSPFKLSCTFAITVATRSVCRHWSASLVAGLYSRPDKRFSQVVLVWYGPLLCVHRVTSKPNIQGHGRRSELSRLGGDLGISDPQLLEHRYR